MVHSDAGDVDGYLAMVPGERRAVLSGLRDACRGQLTGFTECMKYGMPAYGRDGITEISWASQKRYISLYVLRSDVLDAHRRQLAHLSVGKGCIRYRDPRRSISPLSGRYLLRSPRAAGRSAERPSSPVARRAT
jgi:uncharacterized protein YdhG (YjbR/CyaY superfamily)